MAEAGHELLAALLVGGKEKLPPQAIDQIAGVPILMAGDPRRGLVDALEELRPDAVLDLSDEPVLDYRRRFGLIGVSLAMEVPYEGADFRLEPPPRPRLARHPSIAITGTGKRTGKTAVAGYAARKLTEAGHRPAIVAMGRGGPPDPELLRGDTVNLDARALLELADVGRHAASDYVEDALLGRVPTVGCRRCGGGLAGGVEHSNVAAGVRLADGLDVDLLLFEGSGSAIPPVAADVTALVMPASIPLEYVTGYLGSYRVLISDLVVVTMCEEPFGSPSKVSSLASSIDEVQIPGWGRSDGEPIQVVRTVFRPTPTRSVEGARVAVATTAPPAVGNAIRSHLEEAHRCEVANITHSLSDRHKLEEELKDLKGEVDLLLVEIKAAGIDVAARRALEHDIDVVFMDNEPCSVEGDDLGAALVEAAGRAGTRARETP